MRTISVIVLAVVPLLAAGCNRPAEVGDPGGNAAELQSHQAAAADAAASAETPAGPGTEGHAARTAEAAQRPAPISLPMLAYAHRFMLELPSEQVRPLLSRHEQECVAAGPALCQVMAADARDKEGEASGVLKLRGQALWLARFRAGLERDADQIGGKVTGSGTDTEDMTRSIVDSEAALKAKTVLRDRLQGILAIRSGKLPELLEMEQELARVQGEIDATRSELAVMRARVQTSALTIEYRSIPQMVTARAVEPLKRSVSSVFGIVIAGLAVLITASAVLLPVALVAVPAWLLWRTRRRSGAVKA